MTLRASRAASARMRVVLLSGFERLALLDADRLQGVDHRLVARQRAWKLIANGTGMVSFLDTRGAGGWPNLEVGDPGSCFPVERWNGKEYKLQRYEYEGKPCKPQR
jgi:hypothetical protein